MVLATDRTARPRRLTRLAFRAMGSEVLAVIDREGRRAERLLGQVPRWFAGWEERLSRFRPESELSRLNRCPGQAVPVSRTLWRVLRAALRAAVESDGLVLPTVLPALEAAGYDRDFAEVRGDRPDHPHRDTPSTLMVAPLAAVALDPEHRTVRLTPGARLDFGGVAKGWAADLAAQRLGRHGPALVDAGGDIAVVGVPRGLPGWPIGIADPLTPGRQIALLCLTRGGVATSGRDVRRWWSGGELRHHIIDPRTGRPAATDLLTATVIAPSAREAEVAAKTVLILGRRDGLAWLERRGDLAGLVVTDEGQIERSSRFDRYLWR